MTERQPTETPGTELIRAENGGGHLSFDRAEQLVGELVERGDFDALGELAQQAETYQIYWSRRSSGREQANIGGRVKVSAEAGLGALDLAENPWRAYAPKFPKPLCVGDQEIALHDRARWRVLTVGKMRGALRLVIAELDERGSDITTHEVSRELRDRGVMRVPVAPFRTRATGVERKVLAQRLGATLASVSGTLKPTGPKTMEYLHAVEWAHALELDAAKLPLAPVSKPASKATQRRSRLRPTRQLAGSRWDRTYTALKRLEQEVFALTGEGGAPNLWFHLHAVEDIIGLKVRDL